MPSPRDNHANDGAHLRVGDARLAINDKDAPAPLYGDLLELSVQDDLEAPSMFTLKLSTWDSQKLALSWVDHDLLALGGEVQISLGYTGEVAPVMKGEITGLELEMTAGEPPILLVRGYDRRHRLLRGTRTRSFVQMKDSDIAAQIAREQGLTAKAVDSGVKLSYVLQHAQADLDFLQQRAAGIGYEVVVEDKTLHFRPHGSSQKAAFSLSVNRDILEFFPRMTAQGQAGQVDVRGWDPKNKQAIVGKATAGQEAAMGATSGPKLADKVFGKAVVVCSDHPVSSQAEADKLALGKLQNMALGLIRGEGVCHGRNNLKAGIVVDLVGLGKRFSGAYYVTSTTHTYSSKQGYRTSFTVRRNAT